MCQVSLYQQFIQEDMNTTVSNVHLAHHDHMKRCKAAWYCSKECQTQHWKAGHKIDCIKPTKKANA